MDTVPYHHVIEFENGWTTNESDPFVSHAGYTFAFAYYVRSFFAIGVTGTAYTTNVDSDFDFDVRRASRVTLPLAEYQWAGALNFTYAPLHGKLSFFHFDTYFVGGVGLFSARPVATDTRGFEWKTSGAFDFGVGARVFPCRWFAGFVEVRDWTFAFKPEATTTLVQDVELRIGASIFLPIP